MTETEISEHVNNTKLLILQQMRDTTSLDDKELPKVEKILRRALNAMAVTIVNGIENEDKTP